MKKYLCLSTALVLITSCSVTTPKPKVNYTSMDFDNERALVLNVKKIENKVIYKPSFKSPNIEHLMPYPLERAVLNWADAKILASGKGKNTAEFIIKTASVTEEKTNESLLKGGTREVYTANLEISLEITDEKGKKTEASASSWQQYTSPFIMTFENREKVWFEMVKGITEDAGKKLETTIKQFLPDYIVEYIQ